MEFPSSDGGCVRYDLDLERLFVVRGAEQHEIQVRAQVHRLVRHMAERNAASGGTPALCTYDELMQAVWGDEPMHTQSELAKLVWELRRQLEPLGAADVVVNERRRGYRLVTCDPSAARVGAPAAEPVFAREGAAGGPSPRRRRLALSIVVALIALAAVAAGLAIALSRHSGGVGSAQESTVGARDLFVDRIENVLEQSAAGRHEIRAALTAGFDCSISPDEAARRISSVADNRQSVLEQLGNLDAPTPESAEVLTLLQRALQQSIEADRHYRDGFLQEQAGAPCPLRTNRDFRLAAASDALATSAKKRFVTAFDPLAREAGRRGWTAVQF